MLQGEAPGRTGSACSSTPGASDLLTVPEPSLRGQPAETGLKQGSRSARLRDSTCSLIQAGGAGLRS